MVKVTTLSGSVIDLDVHVTQEEFGQIVGISQQAVSSLMTRGVILPGQTAQQWMDRYLTHLRETIITRRTAMGNP